MRATLEQLKAMSNEELYNLWGAAEFPFEAASCGYCLTNHGCGFCGSHKDIVPFRLADPRIMREHLEELYALRLFYDSLYPRSVEATPSPTEGASSLADAHAELVEKRL